MTTVGWERAPDVLVRRTRNRIVLLPVDTDEPLRLTGTGALVWDLLGLVGGERELVDTVAGVCGEERDEVADAVVGFLEDLERLGAARITGDR